MMSALYHSGNIYINYTYGVLRWFKEFGKLALVRFAIT